MKKSILILISGIALLLASACKRENQSIETTQVKNNTVNPKVAELDSLYDLVTLYSGTNECLEYAEMLYNKAEEYKESGTENYMVDAATNICMSLQGMSRYEEAISYADSISDVLNLKEKSSSDYYFLLYLKCVCLIDLGKYSTAIGYAQLLYEDAKDMSKDEDQVYLRVRCNALILLGLANAENGMLSQAYDNYSECINAIISEAKEKEDPKDKPFLLQLLEAQTYRMMLGTKYNDKLRSLEMLDQYKKEIDEFNEKKAGSYVEDILVDDYLVTMEMNYIDVLCDLKRSGEAYKHVQNAEKIFAENENLMGQYDAEFKLAKAKYYSLIGELEKAKLSADSAAIFYENAANTNKELVARRHVFDILRNEQKQNELATVAERIIFLSDSLTNEKLSSQLADMQTSKDVDKLTQEKANLDLKNQNLQNERRVWTLVAISVFLVALVVFFIFKRRRDLERQRILAAQKQMLEDEVARQTCELREQKEVIEQKNRDITDSINYALRIQQSILPDMSQYTPEVGVEGAFALFIPCHIVSGDFYWTFQRDNLLFFSSVDCTGHGVPGAFMSMIGTTILNDLCNRPEALAPNEILEQLHINLLAVLQQSGDADSRDGMDMSILEYNTETHHVRVSSARRPVYLHIGGEFVEYKGVKRSIGERDYTQETLPFSLGEYDVAAGDSVYMCSDGIGDQFGGPSNKRLKSSGLMKMLQELVILPIGEQQAAIDKMYWDWRGDQEQLDDISLIGVKF